MCKAVTCRRAGQRGQQRVQVKAERKRQVQRFRQTDHNGLTGRRTQRVFKIEHYGLAFQQAPEDPSAATLAGIAGAAAGTGPEPNLYTAVVYSDHSALLFDQNAASPVPAQGEARATDLPIISTVAAGTFPTTVTFIPLAVQLYACVVPCFSAVSMCSMSMSGLST